MKEVNWIRGFFEKISRDRIILRKAFVCKKKIPIFVSPGAQLKYWKMGKGVR